MIYLQENQIISNVFWYCEVTSWLKIYKRRLNRTPSAPFFYHFIKIYVGKEALIFPNIFQFWLYDSNDLWNPPDVLAASEKSGHDSGEIMRRSWNEVKTDSHCHVGNSQLSDDNEPFPTEGSDCAAASVLGWQSKGKGSCRLKRGFSTCSQVL